MTYKYCVVKFLPDISAGELINIGIEIHDMDNLIVYTKYTKNIKEITRRYGYSPMLPILFTGLNTEPRVEDKDYLNKKHEEPNSGYRRIFYDEVCGGIDDTEEALKHLYDIFILLDK